MRGLWTGSSRWPILDVPVDVVVVTEEDVAKYGGKMGTVLSPALEDGLVVYER